LLLFFPCIFTQSKRISQNSDHDNGKTARKNTKTKQQKTGKMYKN